VAQRFGIPDDETGRVLDEGVIRDWPRPFKPKPEPKTDEVPAIAVATEWAEAELGRRVDCHQLSEESAPNAGVAPYFVCTLRRPRPIVGRDTYCQMTIWPHPTPEADGRVDGWCDG
jgi:hypothetical protein